jgi:hypothetical protein
VLTPFGIQLSVCKRRQTDGRTVEKAKQEKSFLTPEMSGLIVSLGVKWNYLNLLNEGRVTLGTHLFPYYL